MFAIGGDGRGAWTRPWKDLYEERVEDLGDAISGIQVGLCRRCTALEVQLEQLEAEMSEGKISPESLDLYGRLAGHCRRTMVALGVERRNRMKLNTALQQIDITQDEFDEIARRIRESV